MSINVNAFKKEKNAKLKAILEYLKTDQATDNFIAKIDKIEQTLKSAKRKEKHDFWKFNAA